MLPLIICHSCGMPLGDVHNIFKLLEEDRKREYVAKTGIDPDMLSVADRCDIAFGDILDKLQIINMCCRTLMFTNMEYKNYY
jgi:DNA-directed RNA polymerase subunit N (RpoN/RPB10)